MGRGIDRTVTFTPVLSAEQEDVGRVAAGGSVFEWVQQRLAELQARLPGLDDAGYGWLEQAGVMAELAETIRVAAGQAAEHWSGEPAAVELQRALAGLWGTAERMGAAASLMGRFVQAAAQHAREAGGRFAEQAVSARRAEQVVGLDAGRGVVVGGPVLSLSDQVAWQVFDGLNRAWEDEAQHTAPHELHVTYPFPPGNDVYDTSNGVPEAGAAWDSHPGDSSAGQSDGGHQPSGGSAGHGVGGSGGGGFLPRQSVPPDPASRPGGGVGGGTGSSHEGGSSLAGGGADGISGGGLSGLRAGGGGGIGVGGGQPDVGPTKSGPDGPKAAPGELGSPVGSRGAAGRGAGPGATSAPGSAGRGGVIVPPTGGHGKDDGQERERRYWLSEDEAWVIEEPLPGVLMGEYKPPSDDDDEDADW